MSHETMGEVLLSILHARALNVHLEDPVQRKRKDAKYEEAHQREA